ncbi:MAG: glycoside hydrolase family 15 protein [Myxococcaceae bacterium]|nr:glycoside hydrolase family 15 protein [Myxococcaceae bacterium]
MRHRIDDYALLGDCHSAALVGRDGAIDWACFPRFDSPAVFCRLLDVRRGGTFRVGPERPFQSSRRYLDDTNVLVTTFTTPTGVLELTDCMPIRRGREHSPSVGTRYSLLRRLRCLGGQVPTRVVVAPRFEYGAFVPRIRLTSPLTAELVGGADALWVTATRPLVAYDNALRARWLLRAGDEAWVEAAWSSSLAERTPEQMPSLPMLRQRLEDTVAFWREWLSQCAYEGAYAPQVRRSALVLKALTYVPSGAIIAAPTTSLPEDPGGVRNWDYRYTWLRDTALTLISLILLGYQQEAISFRHWLLRTTAGRVEDIQIMYDIRGHRLLPEVELGHLEGHRGSRPVRIGNGAVKQLQLDVFGELLEAAWLYTKTGGPLTPPSWAFLRELVEAVCQRWRAPDQGLWEIRDEPRHFLHSKLQCWVALDRAVRIARARRFPAPVGRWVRERELIREYLLREGQRHGWFPQAVGSDRADASVLLLPALGFLPAIHPLMSRTVEVVRQRLEKDGLLYRYHAPDGVGGGEATFLLCSFWLHDVLVHSGRMQEAEALLRHLLSLANDVGLYAEEAVPGTGEAMGNFPQAFTHMALVASCAQLSAARSFQLPRPGAYDFADFALTYHLGRRSALMSRFSVEAAP